MNGIEETLDLVRNNAAFAFVAIASTAGHFAVEPARWWFVLGRRLGVRFSKLMDLFNVTALMSYAMPLKLGLPVRQVLLNRVIGESHLVVGGALILDTVFVYGIWIAASAISIFTVVGGLGEEFDLTTPLIIGGLLVFGGVIAGAWRIAHLGIMNRVREAATRLSEFLSWRSAVVSAGTVLLDIVFQSIKHFAIFELLGLEISFWTAMGIAVVSITVGLLSFLPLGLGAYDAVLIALTAAATGSSGVWMVPVMSRLLNIGVAVLLGGIGAGRIGVGLTRRSWSAEVLRSEVEISRKHD